MASPQNIVDYYLRKGDAMSRAYAMYLMSSAGAQRLQKLTEAVTNGTPGYGTTDPSSAIYSLQSMLDTEVSGLAPQMGEATQDYMKRLPPGFAQFATQMQMPGADGKMQSLFDAVAPEHAQAVREESDRRKAQLADEQRMTEQDRGVRAQLEEYYKKMMGPLDMNDPAFAQAQNSLRTSSMDAGRMRGLGSSGYSQNAAQGQMIQGMLGQQERNRQQGLAAMSALSGSVLDRQKFAAGLDQFNKEYDLKNKAFQFEKDRALASDQASTANAIAGGVLGGAKFLTSLIPGVGGLISNAIPSGLSTKAPAQGVSTYGLGSGGGAGGSGYSYKGGA